MKIVLISLDNELFCYSIRILAACLKQASYRIELIILPPQQIENDKERYRATYPDALLDQLAARCNDCMFVGISLMSNQFIAAIDVTKGLKARGVSVPIIWGGVQPTVEPEECINYADVVCVGEGEETIVELAGCFKKDLPITGVNNVWIRTASGVIKNELRPLITDLDSIPFPDYSCNDHYIVENGRIEPLTKEKFIRYQGVRFKSENEKIIYMFLTSRGCPYSCTYCINSVYDKLYPKQKKLRWRSDENIIAELEMVIEQFGPLKYVAMVDDNFTARSNAKLESFCRLLKEKIGVPFNAQVSPLTIDERKLEILFDAGCTHITMGVETANSRVAEMYNRQKFHRVIKKAISVIEKYRHLQNPPPTYQFIIDNPWETLSEMLETLRLACSFPRPWNQNPIYSLMLFPGVPLFHRAVEEGLITDKFRQIYGRHWRLHSRPYLQLWIRLYHANCHPLLLRLLLLKPVAHIFCSGIINAVFMFKPFRALWEKPS